MSVTYRVLRGILWIGMTVGAAAGTFASDLKSPDGVKTGLHELAKEYSDMGRKVASERYDRLPKDNREFHEESATLRDAIANEPADFKSRVAAALESALTASGHLADVSATHDKKQVESALESLATSLTSLNALFPESVRSEPGTVASGHAGGSQAAPSKSP